MPRNIIKITELQKKINEQEKEINKYKQLIANIQGLIRISEVDNLNTKDQTSQWVYNYYKGLREIFERGEEINKQSDNVVDEAKRRNPDLTKNLKEKELKDEKKK